MNRIDNLESLLNQANTTKTISEMDYFISKLCSYGEELDKLTEAQKTFFFNQWLEREVNNGGFSQYFFNYSGNFALRTVASLDEIGAFHTSNLLQQAIDQFPDKKKLNDRIVRQELMEEIEETAEDVWNQLDNKFFEYQDDLSLLNIEFIRKNKKSF